MNRKVRKALRWATLARYEQFVERRRSWEAKNPFHDIEHRHRQWFIQTELKLLMACLKFNKRMAAGKRTALQDLHASLRPVECHEPPE
ncbi:MAG TPA: hypothetical protein VGE35_00600 [Candidatus Paceibacterota bacterium]